MAVVWQSRSSLARGVWGTTICIVSGSKGCPRFKTPLLSSKNAEARDSDCIAGAVLQKSSTCCSLAIFSMMRGARRLCAGGPISVLVRLNSDSSVRLKSAASNSSFSSQNVRSRAGAFLSPASSALAPARDVFFFPARLRVVTKTCSKSWSQLALQTRPSSSLENVTNCSLRVEGRKVVIHVDNLARFFADSRRNKARESI